MQKRTKRVVFVMIDGIGDRSLPTLAYKTPLQHVDTPNMDLLASALHDLC